MTTTNNHVIERENTGVSTSREMAVMRTVRRALAFLL